MEDQGCGDGVGDLGEPADVQLGLLFIGSVSGADGHRQSVHPSALHEVAGLLRLGVDALVAGARLIGSHVAQLPLYGGAEQMGDLHHPGHPAHVVLIAVGGAVVHNGGEPQAQGLHDLRLGEAVVVVEDHRN